MFFSRRRRKAKTQTTAAQRAFLRRFFRPTVEQLEERRLLTVNVTSNYDGLDISGTQGFVPPDTCGAAGPSSYVETVNQSVALFSPKDTGFTSVSDTLDHFYQTVGGLPATDSTSFLSDPIVVYDDQIQRFIVGDQDVDFSTHNSNFDVAVSKTSNPTDLTKNSWNFYQFNTTENGGSSNNTWDADYPGNFGYNADAFVFTLNMFAVGSQANHVQIVSVNSADLANGVAKPAAFTNDFNGFSLRPTAMHDAKPGDPMWLIQQDPNGNAIDVVEMGNVLSSTATFTLTALSVNPYNDVAFQPPLQPDGSAITFNVDSRILKSAEMKNLIVASHSVGNLNGIEDDAQWYEIDVSSGTPVLKDQGDVSAGPNTYLMYPGVDINAFGAIGMVFQQSGNDNANDFMSVYVTGRNSTDPAGTMDTPILVKAGDSINGDGREGDLTGINTDADGTFYAAAEYALGGSWGTEVVHFDTGGTLTISSINAPTNATEGINKTFTVAVFTDTDLTQTAKDFTVTVSWGDGTTSTFTNGAGITSDGNGQFEIAGTHAYLDEGSGLSVSVLIQDSNNVTTSAVSSLFQVADAPLALTSVNSPPRGLTEGQSTGTFTVATFTDANVNAPVSDFTALIKWGDGTTSTVDYTDGISGSGGNFVVQASHIYDEVINPTVVSIKITDEGRATVSGTSSSTFTVADAPLTLKAINPPPTGLTEGQDSGLFTVATFTDGYTASTASDFTAFIKWGDGSTSVLTASSGISGSGGNYVVQASHTFLEEITTPTVLSVQIFDDGGASLSAKSSPFTVADAPLGNLSISLTSLTEGAGTGVITVATFHDTALGSDATDFTTTISWGDGTSTQGSVVYLGTAGDFAVMASHTYTDETTGPIAVSVQITDHGAPTLSGSVTLTVADAPLSNLTITGAGPTEGSGTGTFTLATFQDANLGATAADFTANISWGDGTSSRATVVSAGSAGTFALLASHTYADESAGPVTLTVQVLDDGGSSISGTLTLTVADASLTMTVVNAPPVLPTEGISTGPFTVATFTDGNLLAPLTDFTAIIQWGDGTTSTITNAGGGITGSAGIYNVVATHTYAEQTATAVALSVQILDEGGASVSGQSSAFTVADAPLSITKVKTPGSALTEGQSTGTFTVATFTDANVNAPLTDFTAIIAWGDGSTTTVTGAGGGITGSAGNYNVLAAHTYEELLTATVVSVQVFDTGGASASGQSTPFTVADAPLSISALNVPRATEGISTGTFTVATFTDGNITAPLSDFTAIIAWGDGTTTTVTSANGISGSAGSYVVQTSHVYAEEGTAVLSVQILDAGGSSASNQTSFFVADAPLSVTAIQPPAGGFTEGIASGPFTVATFTDANTAAPPSNFTAVVTWGDGTTSTLTSGNGLVATGPGAFAVVAAHVYADEGHNNLLVRVTDIGGASAGGSAAISVADAPLSLKSFAPPSAYAQTDFRGTLATFSDANLSAPSSDFTALIAWGDGTSSTGSVQGLGGGVFQVLGEHTYAQPGTLPFTITVQDRGGATLSPTGSALVSPAPTTINVTGISEHYTFNSQQETVTAQVTGPDGQPVKHGSLTFTDGGQSQTVQLVNGQASATFTFGFGHELPNPHPIGVSFSDSSGVYLPSSTTPSAPSSMQDYLFQLEELFLLLLLANNGSGG